jgi:DNA-binding FadR family transcriptional regulator
MIHSHGLNRVFEDVVQQLRLQIAKGALKPGDRLRADRKLAEEFGVARGSVREAIRVLELFGLVTIKRGRGGGATLTQNCRELAEASFTKMSIIAPKIGDSLEFRKSIEPKAAAIAAERRTEQDLALLQKSLDMMRLNLKSSKTFIESNRLFHDSVARATKNPYFAEFIPQFLARPEIVTAAGSSEAIERSVVLMFHRRVVEAIARQDAAAAEFWMMGHITQLEDDVRHARDFVPPKPPAGKKSK